MHRVTPSNAATQKTPAVTRCDNPKCTRSLIRSPRRFQLAVRLDPWCTPSIAEKAAAGRTGVLALKLRPSHLLFSHTQADKTTSAHAFCNEQQIPARRGRKTEMGWGVTPAHTKTHTVSTASAPPCWWLNLFCSIPFYLLYMAPFTMKRVFRCFT